MKYVVFILKAALFGQSDHVRIYGRDYVDRLEKAGFRVTAESYPRDLGHNIIKRYGLSEDEDIFFCTKLRMKRVTGSPKGI